MTEDGLAAIEAAGEGLIGRLNQLCELLAISATQSTGDAFDADYIAALERNLVPTAAHAAGFESR